MQNKGRAAGLLSLYCLCRYRDRGQYDYPPPGSSYRGSPPPTEVNFGSDDNSGNNNGSGGSPNGGGGMDNFTKALIAGAFIMGMGTGAVAAVVALQMIMTSVWCALHSAAATAGGAECKHQATMPPCDQLIVSLTTAI